MRNMLLPACAVLALAAALPATATDIVARDGHAIQQQQTLQRQLIDQRTRAARQGTSALAGVLGEGFGGTNGPYANPYREYPPSCIADPLPATPTGPVYSTSIDLAARNPSLGGYVRETGFTVRVWRIPCSSSQGWDNAVTLMRIERAANAEGNTSQIPLFPGVNVSQGEIGFDDPQGQDIPRVAEEPNTIVSMYPIDGDFIYSTTYVLEAFPVPDRAFLDYTAGFNLRLDNYINDGLPRQFTLQIPAYDPTKYDDAGQPLPINGYMTGNYYDPAHSGEGMAVQVFEREDNATYQISFNWFTFSPDGKPFWITGSAGVEPGALEAVATEVGYMSNGGFAGDFGSSTDPTLWGTLHFSWPDCGHMLVDYESRTDLPSDVPQGSGTLSWIPIGDINGLTCE